MEARNIQRQDALRNRLRWLTRTALLLAITVAVQMLGLPQPITGPAVNAMLILSAIVVGASGGLTIGLLTPLIAFMRGILPPLLGPMIPFIMVGNAALVIIFSALRKGFGGSVKGAVTGLVAGAFVKFLLLAAAVRFVVEVPPPVARAMQVPQLITALTGGAVALIVAEAVIRALRQKEVG